MTTDHSDLARFQECFTQSVIAWNRCEIEMQRIFVALAGNTTGVVAAAANLGNRGLPDAIKAVADNLGSLDIVEHLTHACQLLDDLRGYRNHYVHGIIGAGRMWLGGAFYADAWTLRGKGRLQIAEQPIAVTEIETFWQRVSELHDYLNDIARFLENNPIDAPITWLDKPPKPPQLTIQSRKFQSHLDLR
jgi:hypothetical protein